jgi:hypothetical protein
MGQASRRGGVNLVVLIHAQELGPQAVKQAWALTLGHDLDKSLRLNHSCATHLIFSIGAGIRFNL